MTTRGDVKRHIQSLAEANKELARDLRASEREKDALRHKLTDLKWRAETVMYERDDAVNALDEVRDALRARLESR